MTDKFLIAVIGPTAIGKTSLAIKLAQHLGTEIISADSRQFFKEMRIGTAVPSKEELATAQHHLIQHKSIHEPYSVGDFEKEALKRLSKLYEKKDSVVLVGGSGLYVDAVVNGLDDFPEVDKKIRERLMDRLNNEGLESLQHELKTKDPEYFKRVDLENPHRLVRALEICQTSGSPYSSFLNQKKANRNFNTIYVGLSAERETIYNRINERVDLMMASGLLEEVKQLLPYKSLNALQTVGYKELFTHLKGECDLEFAVEEIKKNTRRFAKRQLTWYRKNQDVLWVDFEEDLNSIIQKIMEKKNRFKKK